MKVDGHHTMQTGHREAASHMQYQTRSNTNFASAAFEGIQALSAMLWGSNLSQGGFLGD